MRWVVAVLAVAWVASLANVIWLILEAKAP